MDFEFSNFEKAAERLKGRIVHTPLLRAPMLDKAADCQLYVKAECLQTTGAFKFRGAMNKILSLTPEQKKQGVLAYSSGNHGHAVAAAAKMHDVPVVIVLPTTVAANKVANCRWWGAEIVFFDPHKDNREEVGKRLSEERNMTLIPPFDDYDIISGQGTCGLEIADQLAALNVKPDAIVVNSSGGGLSSGVIATVKKRFPDVQAYIAEIGGHEKMARSFQLGSPVALAVKQNTILEGINGPIAGTRTFNILRQHNVKCLSIYEDDALTGMAAAFKMLKLVVEPGGAASLGAVLNKKADFAGKNVVVVASGGNVDPEVFAQALQKVA